MPRLEVIRDGEAQPPFLQRLSGAVAAVRSAWKGPFGAGDRELARLFGGPPASSGVTVNSTTALGASVFFRCATLISADIASLPLLVLKRLPGGGKARYVEHPLFRVLHDQANPEQTAFCLRESLLLQALVYGDSYAEVERDGYGRVKALWLLDHASVSLDRDGPALRYRVKTPTGADVFLPRGDTIHLRGPSLDGLSGLDPVKVAREAIGLSLAMQTFSATFFGNGSTFGGAIKHPKVLGMEGARNLRESIERLHRGPDRAHRFLILEEGTTFETHGVNPHDSQLVEGREFAAQEIARFFGVPPSKIGLTKDTNKATATEESLSYYASAIRPWLSRIEAELTSKTLSRAEQDLCVIEHVVQDLLRGSHAERAAFYSSALSHGWMSINEVRAAENLSPAPNGDALRVPLNTTPIDATPVSQESAA